MNIEYFLKLRTAFIRYFYDNAGLPFIEIKTAIENNKEPFVAQYSEDAEPPFLEAWMRAETGVEAIGYACLSMLSSSLHLFLKEWVSRLEQKRGIKYHADLQT